jgi:hypothetical protein
MLDGRLELLKINSCDLYILGVIHGLISERKKVREAFQIAMPSKVALGIPPEDLRNLENHEDFDSSNQEDFFQLLANYGEVAVPPLDLVESIKICEEERIPIQAIDMDDENYAEFFTKNVSIWGILKNSRKMKKMKKKKEKKFATVEEFIKDWDEQFTSIKSFKKVEEKREEEMALKLMKMANEDRILAIVPYQRMEGIVKKVKIEKEK